MAWFCETSSVGDVLNLYEKVEAQSVSLFWSVRPTRMMQLAGRHQHRSVEPCSSQATWQHLFLKNFALWAQVWEPVISYAL